MQLHKSRIELDHFAQANQLAHGCGGRVIFRTMKLPVTIIVVIHSQNRRSVQYEICCEARRIGRIIEYPFVLHARTRDYLQLQMGDAVATDNLACS